MDSPIPPSSCVPGHGHIVATLLATGKTELESISYQYPLKLISPPRSGHHRSVLVFLMSYGGGLVGGDHISLSIGILAGARLCIATQGHTKIFTARGGRGPLDGAAVMTTRQQLQVRVGNGAAFCMLPDPVQPFRGSAYEQTQTFRLGPDGSACILDWVTQGRTARGERWSFASWIGRNEVWLSGGTGGGDDGGDRLLLRDTVILDTDDGQVSQRPLEDAMDELGVFGTLILRGAHMRPLGDFFVREFTALPRLGGRGLGENLTGALAGGAGAGSDLESWRAGRVGLEQARGVMWTAAQVRGCVVVKFGAPTVEAARVWVGSMLVREGSVAAVFGDQALMCVR